MTQLGFVLFEGKQKTVNRSWHIGCVLLSGLIADSYEYLDHEILAQQLVAVDLRPLKQTDKRGKLLLKHVLLLVAQRVDLALTVLEPSVDLGASASGVFEEQPDRRAIKMGK